MSCLFRVIRREFLVTSDAPLRDSKRIHKILEVLFVQVGAQVWRLEASFPARQDRYSENDVGREAMALCIALYGTTERRLDSEPPG